MRANNITKKLSYSIVPALFIILIAFPGILTLLKLATGKSFDRTLRGNFDPVKIPVLAAESLLDKSFQSDFETYFHNTFTGRGYLITTYNQIRHSLFDENPQNCISDSLIFEPYIIAHMGIEAWNYSSPERSSELEEYTHKLSAISDLLENRGKYLIVVTAPSKASWFEDDIPTKYTLMPHGLGVTDYFDELISGTNILYLNSERYLEEISFPYPVFYKSSHHCSRTAEAEMEKKILDIINAQTPFEVETYDITATIESATPFDRDADTLSIMNLWFPTDEKYYKYEINVNSVSQPTNICIQGDSFTSLIASDLVNNGHNGIVSNIYYDEVYYVDNEQVCLIEHDFSHLDINKIIEENDVFVILYTDYNLPSYGYGFVDALYNSLCGSEEGEH